MALRHIQVGDNLSGKVLHFTFDDDTYMGDMSDSDFIVATGGKATYDYGMSPTTVPWEEVYVKANSDQYSTTICSTWAWSVSVDYTELKLASDFGTVTSIDTNCSAYQYFWYDPDERTSLPIHKGGNDVAAMYKGNVQVSKMYKGSTQIF